MAFTVDYTLKDWFFDRQEIQNRVDKGTARALSRIGAFIRTRARTDVLRRRKATSRDGQPPSVHSTDSKASLKNILFGLNPDRQSVVIGPVKLQGASTRGNSAIIGTYNVPEILEYGGSGRILEAVDPITGRPLRYIPKRLRGKVKYRTRNVRIKARPFMSVALERERAKGTILKAFENLI